MRGPFLILGDWEQTQSLFDHGLVAGPDRVGRMGAWGARNSSGVSAFGVRPWNHMNETLKLLAGDLTTRFPRSPRETLAGYVVAARMLDKCRSFLVGTNGDYHFNCLLDQTFLSFAEIDADRFKEFVAGGATDDEVAAWIEEQARRRSRLEIIKWNNSMRDKRVGDMPDEAQEFLEDYIAQCIPRNRPVYCWFDVYDLEEQRI